VSDPADDIAEIWLALTDEQRDDLLAARHEALRRGQDDEPE
jgi:hypothetical protein